MSLKNMISVTLDLRIAIAYYKAPHRIPDNS